MKKIALITYGDSNNRKLWSGTPSRLREEFSGLLKRPIETINYRLPRWWRSLCFRLFMRQEFVAGCSRDPWYRKWSEYQLTQKLKKVNYTDTRFLFIGAHNCLSSLKQRGKFAIYIDNILEIYMKHLNGDAWWRGKYEEYIKKYDRESFQNADFIFTQNEWTKKALLEQMSIPPEKVMNVGFGVNLSPYYGEKDYCRKELLIVLRRGTEHYKGLDLLLEAFKILHQHVPEVTLDVVGTTGDMINGVTYWEGYPREKTVELFQRATLYVMPALREPNGITYLEGLANRSPIVGLNRFAFPEFSGYGNWGFGCEDANPTELANVLEYALSDPKRLEEMGKKGQAYVSDRFNWGQVTQNIFNMLQQL